MNILAYSGATHLEVTTKDGKNHRGSAPEIASEADSGYGEPCLSMTAQNGVTDFPQSSIRVIRVLEMPEIDPAARETELRSLGWTEDLIAEAIAVYHLAVRRNNVRPTTDWRI